MTRKDRFGEVLHRVLEDKGSAFAGYAWVPLLDMTEKEYAAQLGETAVYLASSTQEGLHVSVLEAMACGCVVVGFTGIGGSDYMVGKGPDQNCNQVENGNYPELGKVLELVIREREEIPGCHDQIIKNGLATAAHYQDCDKEAADLAAFYEGLVVR
jgi:glycosyltransferase involved in cell wall biosynthesis